MSQQTADTEVALARPAVAWLNDTGWQVYQEVETQRGGHVADIMATKNGQVWVLECKKSLGLAVMAQARYWQSYAHYVSVVVPGEKCPSKERILAIELLHHLGIGLIVVKYNWSGIPCVYENILAVLNPKATGKAILRNLNEAQKTWAEAGNAEHKRWTPFQDTSAKIKEYVEKHPGCTIDQLVTTVPTHYTRQATAKMCIAKYVRTGVIKGVRGEQVNGIWHLYPGEMLGIVSPKRKVSRKRKQ